MVWKAPTRNTDGIQFQAIREKVDAAYNDCHDALTAAYYAKEKFVWNGTDYGVLDKALYDTLHGLIFNHRDVKFHNKNTKAIADKAAKEKDKKAAGPEFEPVDEKNYRFISFDDGTKIDKIDAAKTAIAEAKKKGVELVI